MADKKHIYKSQKNKIFTGVMGGIGEYFGIDPTIIRLGWILVIVFTGFAPGILVYFIAAFIVPYKKETS